MRAILAIAALVMLATSPADARHWGDTPPPNPLAITPTAPPPTDADLVRNEAAHRPGPKTGADDLSDELGLANGREQLFGYRLGGATDSGVTGWVDGDGAEVELRW